MGPYTCIAENCGKTTLNDNHLCDECDPIGDELPTLCERCGEPAVGRDDGEWICAKCYQSRPIPRDFHAYEDYCDRRDCRKER